MEAVKKEEKKFIVRGIRNFLEINCHQTSNAEEIYTP